MGVFGPNIATLKARRDIPGLISCLRHKSQETRSDAMAALAAIGPEAVGSLCAALRDRDETTRWVAALALGLIGDARAAVPLREAFRVAYDTWVDECSPSALSLIKATADALGLIGDKEAVNLLCAALIRGGIFAHGVGGMRNGVMLVLDPQDLASVVATIIGAIGRIGALGRIDDARVAELLCSLLGRGSSQTRDAAEEALVKLGTIAVDALCGSLGHEDPNRRLQAVRALGRIRNARAVGPLRNLLNDPVHLVRKAAKEALTPLGTS